ncbi:MAG: O-acetyl-ADP-ribose deacetylase [Candidatus Omnitrophota bacterium]|jgi:O-acetyl-ADP-ribose deacetylase (regulator of RNase III)
MKTKIEIVKGDITKIEVEAIVNAANTSLLGGGGVDGAIHRAAGPQLLSECRTLNGCDTGQAKITKGYKLPAGHVIHTVGPVWRGGTGREEQLLVSCYRNCFKLVGEHALKSIAFPSVSTGVYRFPIEKASFIALNESKAFLNDNSHVIDKIIFVLFSESDLQVYLSSYNKVFSETAK